MAELLTLSNFIDGKFVPPSNGQYMDNFNPSTGKVYSRLPDSGKEDVDQAVESAKKAFKTWSKTTVKYRSDLLYKLADLIDSKIDEFAQAESKDQGKPVEIAKNMDISRVSQNLRFFAGAVLHHENESALTDPGVISYTVRQPVGVCGLISPWNLPLYLLFWKIAPALAVGNTCVCKASEFTPVTAYMFCNVLNEAGIPPGVCNMVFGRGASTGRTLVTHPDVPLISFTGGTATGEHIARDAAPFHKKMYLELGGKNPNIIFSDCDLDEAVATSVRSSFLNQGEICLCGSRILVQEEIYEKFLEKFVEATKKLAIVGDPKDKSTMIGALVSDDHRKKVEYYIELAKTEGGKIAYGGDRPKFDGDLAGGYFLNPTIITDLPANCRTQQEEIFGPVVGITKFKTEEEGIEIANGVKFGLSASVWTKDIKRANRVSLALECGTVWVNCWLVRDLRLPIGGVKHSGIGRAGGVHSIDFYTEHKTIQVKYA